MREAHADDPRAPWGPAPRRASIPSHGASDPRGRGRDRFSHRSRRVATLSRRLAAVLLVVIAGAAPALAGPDEDGHAARRRALEAAAAGEDRILTTMLASSDATDVAWAAHVVRSERRVQLRPALRAAVARTPGLPPFAAQQILDCALELGCAVPLQTALHFAQAGPAWCRVPAVLAATELTGPEALELWDRLDGPQIGLDAVTVGVRLSKARTDGFGRRLLAGLEFTLVVTATDATTTTGDLKRPGGSVPADGVLVRDARFPPFIVHQLSLAPTAGGTVVSDDPIPVYLQRVERTEPEIGVGARPSADAQVVRRALLLHMLRGAAADRPITDGRVLQVQWTTSERFLEAVGQGQRALVAAYWELVETCISNGLLSRDDAAGLRPTMDVSLFDERATPGPLPAAPPFDLANPHRPRSIPGK